MDIHNQNEIFDQHISNLQTEFILVDHGLCPDWARETHRRRRDCVYFIMGGEGCITVNGEVIYPNKNDMVLLPKNSMVSLYSENETCYNKYWCDFVMHIDGVSLFDVIDFPYMVKPRDSAHALELFKRLDTLHLKTDAASALMLKATLLEIISLFLENDNRHTVHTAKTNLFVETIKKFIYDNIDTKLSVKTLANKMCFNEKYFISVFNQNFGTTPAQYIKSVRLEMAKSKLLYTDDKVVNIVNYIGYSSIQKLSNDFKAYTGFTPSEFRKKFNNVY